MSDFDANSYAYLDYQRVMRDTYAMDAAAKAAYLDGLVAGMMGFPADHLTGPALQGHILGEAGAAKSKRLREEKAARDEAFIERQREKGRRSAESRRSRAGNAQPNHGSGDCRTTVRETSNHGSNHGSGDCRTTVRETSNHGSNHGSGIFEPLRKEGRKEEREADASLLTAFKPNLSLDTARERSGSTPPHGSADAKIPCPRDQQPSKVDFVRYAAARWPEWHSDAVEGIWELWSRQGSGWCMPDGSRIRDWLALLEKFRRLADPANLGERLRLGRFAAEHLADLAESMSFKP